MTKRLEGKVAIITGAGSPVGIGREVALAMAAEGAKVVVNDIFKDPDGSYGADRMVKLIRDAGGTGVANYDSVTSMEGGLKIIKTAVDAFGKVDILVNTAGNIKIAPTVDFAEKDWDNIIAVHVKGMFACTQAALKVMIPQKTGRIINFTSIAAYPPGIGPGASIAYCSAKAAVIGFTRSTANELEPYGITVNAIAPAATTTLFPKEVAPGQPEPKYIAPIIVYLAGDEAKEITSQIISVRGNHLTFHDPIMQNPGPHQWYHKSGKWTIDELAQIVPRIAFKG
jgi:NAD(P)-dependent dehydrogenase (short-subunit alcohol dehydrogenase family)